MLNMANVEEMTILEPNLKTEIYEIRDRAQERGLKLRSSVVNLMDGVSTRIVDQGFTFHWKDDRFFSFTTPVSQKPNIDRVFAKLKKTIKILKRDGEWDSAKNNAWSIYINDLSRFRIVCCYLSDVYLLADHIGRALRDSLRGGKRSIKDYILGDRPNKRANAAKSIHFRFNVEDDIVVELQILTLLHFGWDQIEHLHYERVRGGRLNKRIDLQYWALSDALYVFDEQLMSLDQSMSPDRHDMNGLLNDWRKFYGTVVS